MLTLILYTYHQFTYNPEAQHQDSGNIKMAIMSLKDLIHIFTKPLHDHESELSRGVNSQASTKECRDTKMLQLVTLYPGFDCNRYDK